MLYTYIPCTHVNGCNRQSVFTGTYLLTIVFWLSPGAKQILNELQRKHQTVFGYIRYLIPS